ncbi:hypothetical protein RSOLAG1IB_06465 [Rhizoctonia solani AG-1 IB]|uniref:C2H2-type domain-containing protein n=1 Tax=Thanatephorus cucumeris (strain AG1-IB / isolate 7/3/14) TaxID=1108050 RepID=A0A0B7F7V4_THACB|nr:hypothetical protein RSOLAG1IB_06465 [Rhizoctonia solani AG-1 IB]
MFLGLPRPPDGRPTSGSESTPKFCDPLTPDSSHFGTSSKHGTLVKRELSPCSNLAKENGHGCGRMSPGIISSKFTPLIKTEPQQLDTTDFSTAVKLELNTAATSCGTPVLKSLLGFNLKISGAAEQRGDGSYNIKTEPIEQHGRESSYFKPTIEHNVPERVDTSQVVVTNPGICGTRGHQTHCNSPAINDSDNHQELQESGSQTGYYRFSSQSPHISSYASQTFRELHSRYVGTAIFLSHKQFFSHSELGPHSYLAHPCPPALIVNQPVVERRSPPDLRLPPSDGDGTHNRYEALPSSPLKSSLFGFTKCFGTRPEMCGSSPNSTNLSNTSNTSVPCINSQLFNTTGVPSCSVYESGQHVNPGANGLDQGLESTLTQLDPQSVHYGMLLGYQAALGRPGLPGILGVPQDYVPYAFSVAPNPPIPVPSLGSNEQYSPSNITASTSPSVSTTRRNPQPYFSIADSRRVDPNELYHPSASTSQAQAAYMDMNSSWTIQRPLIPNNYYGHSISGSDSPGSFTRMPNSMGGEGGIGVNLSTGQHDLPPATGLDTNYASSGAPNPSRIQQPSSRTCLTCGKVLSRPSDLADHMHSHGQVKSE